MAKSSTKKSTAVKSSKSSSTAPGKLSNTKKASKASPMSVRAGVKTTTAGQPVSGKSMTKPVNGKSKSPTAAGATAPSVAPVAKAKKSRPILPIMPDQLSPEQAAAHRERMRQAVPTADNKPRKNQAGLTAKEIEHFRDLLLEKRRELVGDMDSMEGEALRSSGSSNLSTLPMHMADMGTDNYEQEFTLGLVEKDRNLLRELNHALAKIQNGTYGVCEGTGKPIAKVRLEAQPWARFSIEHARAMEKSLLIRQ